MTKTEEVLKCLTEGKDTQTIKTETGASESLITRCRKRIDASKKEEPEEPEEIEPTDEELDTIIKHIQIKPEEKYLSKEEEKEDYHCIGCGHNWKSASMPLSCPKCLVEF